MGRLTVVCSSALLYDTALQFVTGWNQQKHPHVTVELTCMTPEGWEEKRKAGEIQGDVMLLEGLPWKMRLFSPIQEYEYLDFGVKIGKAEDFEVILANPDKLLKISECEEFYCRLDCYIGRRIKRVYPVVHSLVLYYFAVMVGRMTLQKIPVLPMLVILFTAYLWREREYVKQWQYLYGTVLSIRSYLFLLPDISKPADIQ